MSNKYPNLSTDQYASTGYHQSISQNTPLYKRNYINTTQGKFYRDKIFSVNESIIGDSLVLMEDKERANHNSISDSYDNHLNAPFTQQDLPSYAYGNKRNGTQVKRNLPSLINSHNILNQKGNLGEEQPNTRGFMNNRLLEKGCPRIMRIVAKVKE